MRTYGNNNESNDDDLDLNLVRDNLHEYRTNVLWASDNNSLNTSLASDVTWRGNPDHITGWDQCTIQISDGAGKLQPYSLVYNISMDGGRSYSFPVVLSEQSRRITFPLRGQYGYLTLTTDASFWAPVGTPSTTKLPIQLSTVYTRSTSGAAGGGAVTSTSNVYAVVKPDQPVLNVRVMNDFNDDYIRGLAYGRSTGFFAGYTSDCSRTTFQSVGPNKGLFWPLPAAAGVTMQISSSSTQDSAGGTGIAAYFLVLMKPDYSYAYEFVFLNGTTPVTLTTTNIYRFYVGFPAVSGATYNRATTVGSNRGIIYVGSGAFSTATGFATNYCFNRIDDGVIPISIYTVPKGKRALLFELKYAADGANPVTFRTYGTDTATSCWSLQIEDIVTNTIQPRRSLIGGWRPPGAEWSCVCKSGGAGTTQCNVIATIIEIDETMWAVGPGVP
jgi:hypothetical protein